MKRIGPEAIAAQLTAHMSHSEIMHVCGLTPTQSVKLFKCAWEQGEDHCVPRKGPDLKHGCKRLWRSVLAGDTFEGQRVEVHSYLCVLFI